jgi:hypothetical protein
MTDCDTDRHVLVVDNFTCTLYEAWRCQAPANELGEQRQTIQELNISLDPLNDICSEVIHGLNQLGSCTAFRQSVMQFVLHSQIAASPICI